MFERKADFSRCLVNALTFFGGSPRKIIFDNLKTAVIHGAGRYATMHPEFLELCGYFYLEPIAYAARDPESKGTVEVNVRYVKQNALAGRDDQLTCWSNYQKLATYWRDEVARRLRASQHHNIVGRHSCEVVVECRTFQPLHFVLGDPFLGNAAKQVRDPTRPSIERCRIRERTVTSRR